MPAHQLLADQFARQLCGIEGAQVEQRHAELRGSQPGDVPRADQTLLDQVLHQRKLAAGRIGLGLQGRPLIEQAGSHQLPADTGEGCRIVHETFLE